MKRALAATGTIALLVLSGCGAGSGKSSDAGSSAGSQSVPVRSTPATATAAPRTLHDSCPLIEHATPGDPIVSAARWARSASQLRSIAAAGDQETKNAMAGLQKAVERLAGDPPSGLPQLHAQGALLAAIVDLRHRCHAVGSSAFQ